MVNKCDYCQLLSFARYIYPFFGCQIPVLVQPAVSLVPGVEHHFSASPSSFKFACSEMSLKTQLHCHPLSLEVWTSQEESDNLAGVAKVCKRKLVYDTFELFFVYFAGSIK